MQVYPLLLSLVTWFVILEPSRPMFASMRKGHPGLRQNSHVKKHVPAFIKAKTHGNEINAEAAAKQSYYIGEGPKNILKMSNLMSTRHNEDVSVRSIIESDESSISNSQVKYEGRLDELCGRNNMLCFSDDADALSLGDETKYQSYINSKSPIRQNKHYRHYVKIHKKLKMEKKDPSGKFTLRSATRLLRTTLTSFGGSTRSWWFLVK